MPSPFDLPEIAAVIFAYLDRQSLVSCIRVCKFWNVHCLPLVWRSVPLILYRRTTISELAEQDYYSSLDASTHSREHDPNDGINVNLATRLQWVHDLQVITPRPSQRIGRFEFAAAHRMMRLCSNLRRLEIDHIGDPLYSLELFNPKLEHVHIRNVYSESFLRSALNHFRDIESIALDRLGPSMISVLADTFESLPRLRDLCITYRAVSLNEKDYAKLLAAGGSNRWRKIDLPCLGLNVVAALAHHADTLEHLTVKKLDSNVDQSLVDLLASCTRIRYLHLHSHVFNAQTFIDYSNNLDGKQEEELEQLQQPQQQCRPLRPWKCEKTLVEFKARIGCIPRSDIPLNLLGKPHDDEGVCLSEIYPGQSHELQEQVMTRLGRFHNLQHIQLGLEDLTEDVRQRIKNSANHQGPPYDDPSYQYECLDMTLENGLGMLHQLRQLRHLNVGRMASRIGPKEVEWMIEHWPRLRVIEGLCPNEESKVKSKFQELAPHIQAIEFLPIV